MGVREWTAAGRWRAWIVPAAILVVAAGLVVWQFGGGGHDPTAPVERSFYSEDDGKTWFTDAANKIPPWDRNGKQVVRAYVFTCDGGKTKFVGFLERYNARGKAQREAAQRNTDPSAAGAPTMGDPGIEVKPPLTGEWVSRNSPAAIAIMNVKCPSGDGQPDLVLP